MVFGYSDFAAHGDPFAGVFAVRMRIVGFEENLILLTFSEIGKSKILYFHTFDSPKVHFFPLRLMDQTVTKFPLIPKTIFYLDYQINLGFLVEEMGLKCI